MSIYVWDGQVELMGPYVTATHMTIDAIVDLPDGRKKAEGFFELHDHVEGSDGYDPWEAIGVRNEEKIVWTVRRKDDGEFCFQTADGELLFTLIGSVNDAIRKFIISQLDLVVNT